MRRRKAYGVCETGLWACGCRVFVSCERETEQTRPDHVLSFTFRCLSFPWLHYRYFLVDTPFRSFSDLTPVFVLDWMMRDTMIGEN